MNTFISVTTRARVNKFIDCISQYSTVIKLTYKALGHALLLQLIINANRIKEVDFKRVLLVGRAWAKHLGGLYCHNLV